MDQIHQDNQNDDFLLPQRSWNNYEKIVRAIAEDEDSHALPDDLAFLEQIGFLCPEAIFDPKLSERGIRYYEYQYIKGDIQSAEEQLQAGLLTFPPCEIILQLLWGVKKSTKINALSILKSRGFWHYTSEAPLLHLLHMMNASSLIKYSKKFKTLQVLYNSTEDKNPLPSSIFIDPERPYSNKMWLKRVLLDCTDYIYWIDKHFSPAALEYIWEIADANKIKEIKILSLALESQISKKALKEYRDLQKELGTKGISLKWYKIDSLKVRDTHDRWIISEKKGWNIPDVNTIISGNRSEINRSENFNEVGEAFLKYVKYAVELT